MMQLPAATSSTTTPMLTFRIRKVGVATLWLPSFAFIFCIGFSYMSNFKEATDTHCKVYNFAPSISAAIRYKPQKNIWQYCIILHLAPRFLFGYVLCNHLKSRMVPSRGMLLKWLPNVALITEWLENASLLLLSVVTSDENFKFHKIGFISFCFFAVAHQGCIMTLINYGNYQPSNLNEHKAVAMRCYMFRTTFTSLMSAIFFYWRHKHCEPYMFSFFCLAEYAFVLATIAFHGAQYYEVLHVEVQFVDRANGTQVTLVSSP